MYNKSKNLILEILKGKKKNTNASIIEKFNLKTDKKNQFVIFFKPEVFLNKTPKQIEKIINLAFDNFEKFGVEILGSAHFPGPSLAEFGIMDKHYGVINRLSKNASKILSKEEKENLLATLQIKNNNIKILGGHEVFPLSKMQDVSAFNDYWQQKGSTKIKSGFYVRLMDINGEDVVVVNGFHPQQLAHYTNNGHEIIMLLAASDKPWSEIRIDMIGDSFPDKAKPESIRGDAYKNAHNYGFESVGIDNNLIHLSAGPTEAIFEMHNFLSSAFEIDILKEAQFAVALSEIGFTEDETLKIIQDKEVHDALEHKDTQFAIEFLKNKKTN